MIKNLLWRPLHVRKLEGLHAFLWSFWPQGKQRVTVNLGNHGKILLFILPCSGKPKEKIIQFFPLFLHQADCGAFYELFSLYVGVLIINIRIKYIFYRWELSVNYFIRQGVPLRRSINNFHILVPSEVVWFLAQRIWNKKSLNPCWIPKDLIKNCFSVCL